MTYRYYIALAVPDAAREAAQSAFAQTTGRAADLRSFHLPCTDSEGARWWVCSTPMTADNFARLDDWQEQIGGAYGVLREVVDGRIVRRSGMRDWLDSVGLARVGDERVSINHGTAGELETLAGVGPTLAQRIIDDRPYSTVDDLTRVDGVSQGMVDDWREEIRV